jgi:hypothetical protein
MARERKSSKLSVGRSRDLAIGDRRSYRGGVARVALAAAALALAAAPPAAAAPYGAVSGSERTSSSFAVGYAGSGTYKTDFHGEPPNPGGDADTNDAHDSSAQAWDIRFRRALVIPDCSRLSLDGGSVCADAGGVDGARGRTAMTGKVDHTHVDGLYRQLDRRVSCRLRRATSARTKVDAAVAMRYLPEQDSFAIQARSPLTTVIDNFPGQCPRQGDSIDRVLDFYAMPGFSFASEFGPERWFTSAEVVIPAAVLHRSRRITIPLRNTAAGRPPKNCAVNDPSFERCRTGGRWRGILTLEAKNR